MRTSLVLSLVLALGACGGNSSTTVDAPTAPIDGPAVDAPAIDAPAIDAPAIDAPPPVDAAVDAFAPAMFDLPGGANALRWDEATSTLYLTDANADALLKYTDAAGIQTVGTLPAASAGISLGDIVKRADGSVIIPNFGFGTQGNLFAMSAAGVGSAFTGLAVNRRRIGLSQDSSGVLYSAYFVGGGSGMPTGGLATVTINGSAATENDITTSMPLKKIVGIVATTTDLFVTDQTDGILYKVAVPAGTVTTVAAIASPDLLTMMPNGDLISGGGAAMGIRRITQAGAVTTIFTGFDVVHGVAYDPALHRLFFVVHSATAGVPDRLMIRALD
jgi:hypothetical protein